MSKLGTLKELNVKPGDVVRLTTSPVEWIKDGKEYEIRSKETYNGPHSTKGDIWAECSNGYWVSIDCEWLFELVSSATPETDYNDGKWHGWNGGECPVHPKTVVDAMRADGEMLSSTIAEYISWCHYLGDRNIVAFRVIKEHKEPREWWVHPHCNDVSSSPVCGYVHVREVIE